jgi:hypothetical protein
MSEAVYVVMMLRDAEILLPDGSTSEPRKVWVDVGTVGVPPRTHRKTVIEKALTAESLGGATGRAVRVLDAESARETPVGMEQPPPRLKIG